MPDAATLLTLLARDPVCSGSTLGRLLGVSRAAVHKTIAQLVQQGVVIESQRGEGYRLDPRFRPLDAAQVCAEPGFMVEVLQDTDSTNRELFRRLDQGQDLHGHVLFAERQTAGVGRRGRSWSAAPYSNIVMSCAWRFAQPAAQLGGLSLVVGLAVHAACEDYGIRGLMLKWPNDLVHGVAKVGGILLDVRGESEAPTLVVCGIGVNVYVPPAVGATVDQAWTDLHRILGEAVDRTRFARLLLRRLHEAFRTFAAQGFAGAAQRAWEGLHRDQGQEIQVYGADGSVCTGQALGIAPDGGLRVRLRGGVQVLYSGDVRVRAVSHPPSAGQRDA